MYTCVVGGFRKGVLHSVMKYRGKKYNSVPLEAYKYLMGAHSLIVGFLRFKISSVAVFQS